MQAKAHKTGCDNKLLIMFEILNHVTKNIIKDCKFNLHTNQEDSFIDFLVNLAS